MVEVKLEVLVVPEETATLLVNRKAIQVLLIEKEAVLAPSNLHLQFR